MVSTEAIYIGGAVAIGAVIMGVLFLGYPELMFPQSGVSSQSVEGGVPIVSPQETITAGDGSAVGNSTNSTTAGTTAPAPYSATPMP